MRFNFSQSAIFFFFIVFALIKTTYANCVINLSQIAPKIGLASSLVSTSNLEIPECVNLSVGDDYIAFILNNTNRKLNNGIRSELAIGYPYLEGDVVHYSWSMLLPSESFPQGDFDKWWLVAQWHDQPDPKLGETWSSFKSQSPPVAIYVERRGGDVGIGLSKSKGVKVTWGKVPLDKWLNVEVLIKWSTANDGFVDLNVSNLNMPSLRQSFQGSNMNNSYHHYFKVGQYRHPDYSIKSQVLVKNISFSKN